MSSSFDLIENFDDDDENDYDSVSKRWERWRWLRFENSIDTHDHDNNSDALYVLIS